MTDINNLYENVKFTTMPSPITDFKFENVEIDFSETVNELKTNFNKFIESDFSFENSVFKLISKQKTELVKPVNLNISFNSDSTFEYFEFLNSSEFLNSNLIANFINSINNSVNVFHDCKILGLKDITEIKQQELKTEFNKIIFECLKRKLNTGAGISDSKFQNMISDLLTDENQLSNLLLPSIISNYQSNIYEYVPKISKGDYINVESSEPIPYEYHPELLKPKYLKCNDFNIWNYPLLNVNVSDKGKITFTNSKTVLDENLMTSEITNFIEGSREYSQPIKRNIEFIPIGEVTFNYSKFGSGCKAKTVRQQNQAGQGTSTGPYKCYGIKYIDSNNDEKIINLFDINAYRSSDEYETSGYLFDGNHDIVTTSLSGYTFKYTLKPKFIREEKHTCAKKDNHTNIWVGYVADDFKAALNWIKSNFKSSDFLNYDKFKNLDAIKISNVSEANNFLKSLNFVSYVKNIGYYFIGNNALSFKDEIINNDKYLSATPQEARKKNFAKLFGQIKTDVLMIDDRFKWILKQYLQQNIKIISDELENEILMVFSKHPYMLIPFRIQLNYLQTCISKCPFYSVECPISGLLIHADNTNLLPFNTYEALTFDSLASTSKLIKFPDTSEKFDQFYESVFEICNNLSSGKFYIIVNESVKPDDYLLHTDNYLRVLTDLNGIQIKSSDIIIEFNFDSEIVKYSDNDELNKALDESNKTLIKQMSMNYIKFKYDSENKKYTLNYNTLQNDKLKISILTNPEIGTGKSYVLSFNPKSSVPAITIKKSPISMYNLSNPVGCLCNKLN